MTSWSPVVLSFPWGPGKVFSFPLRLRPARCGTHRGCLNFRCALVRRPGFLHVRGQHWWFALLWSGQCVLLYLPVQVFLLRGEPLPIVFYFVHGYLAAVPHSCAALAGVCFLRELCSDCTRFPGVATLPPPVQPNGLGLATWLSTHYDRCTLPRLALVPCRVVVPTVVRLRQTTLA